MAPPPAGEEGFWAEAELAAPRERPRPAPAISAASAATILGSSSRTLLSLPGIVGDSNVEGHAGSIELDQVNFGFFRPIFVNRFVRELGATVVADLNFSAALGKAWPPLVDALDDGTLFDSAKIAVFKTVNDRLQTLATLDFRNAIVSSANTSATGAERAGHGVSLNFTRLDATINMVDFTGKKIEAGASVSIGVPIDGSKLNLFGRGGGANPAPGEFGIAAQIAAAGTVDATLVGDVVGPVRGSLHFDENSGRLLFIKSGDPLLPDRYTFRLNGGPDGVLLTDGSPIDGDADGAPGGDFVEVFTVEASRGATLLLPDIIRGPGQPVELATGADGSRGIPISIRGASGATSIQFALDYDFSLLTIGGGTLATGLADDWELSIVSEKIPGQLFVRLNGTTPLPDHDVALVVLNAAVPTEAPIGASTLLRIDAIELAAGRNPVAGVGDQALQTVAYVGDSTGNGAYSGLDASLVARIAVGLDQGFDRFPLVDPLLIGDVTGNGEISGLDAAFVARKAVGLPQPQIPDLPFATPAPTPAPAAMLTPPLSQADLEEDETESEESISLPPPDEPILTYRAPLWQAVDEVLAQTDVSRDFWTNDDAEPAANDDFSLEIDELPRSGPSILASRSSRLAVPPRP